ncbi:hypothetical protein LJC57_02900 [Parabacteroides sp. OttesenSCG-928-G07]|nr:hypothetical protein [Parabacteroides sp. OttesenSCG-928-G07]
MKKLFLYALTAVFMLNLFAACSDDDDDDNKPQKEAWEELSKTYGKSELSLTLNAGMLVSYDDRAIVVDATSATAATFTLKNMLPEGKEITMPVSLTQKGNSFDVAGSTTVNGSEVAVTGTMDKDKAVLGFTRKLSKDLANSLKLDFISTEYLPMPIANIYAKVSTGDAAQDAEITQTVKMGLGALIGSKVSAVNVSLAENGMFDASWIKLGETESINIKGALAGIDPVMGAVLAQMLNIHYFAQEGNFYLMLDKGLLSMIPESMLGSLPIDLTTILAMLEDLGGYYGVPVNYMQSIADGSTTFYIEKDKFLQIMGLVGSMLEDVPEELQKILAVASTAQQFDFGLIFE